MDTKHSSKENIIVFFALCAVFIFALFIRHESLPDKLLFGGEQGRDGLVARDIAQGKKFTLLGPKTDIDGLFHGAGYYYLLAGIYRVAHFDPAQVALIFIAINALGVFILYGITYSLSKNNYIALLSSILFAVSYVAIVYGRWISNVGLSLITTSLFFFFLVRLIITKKSIYWIPLLCVFGVSLHLELLHAVYGLCMLFVCAVYFKISIKNRFFILGVLIFFLFVTPFMVFELRHDFLQINAVIHYLQQPATSHNPLIAVLTYIKEYYEEFVLTLFPKNGVLILAFFILLNTIYLKKGTKRVMADSVLFILSLWSFPHVFLLKEQPLPQYFLGTSTIIIVAFSYLVGKNWDRIPKIVTLVVLGALFAVNTPLSKTRLPQRESSLLMYKDQLHALSYIYSQRDNDFSWDALTMPYSQKQGWEYLMWWYGTQNYIKKHTKNQSSSPKKNLYLIIEPSTEDPWREKWISEYKKTSTIIETKTFGAITVEKRANLLQ